MSIALGIPEGALAVLRNTMAEEALVSEKITQHPRPDLRLKRRAVVLCAAVSLLPAACVSPGNDRFAPFTVTLGTTRGASPFRANVSEYLHELWIEERS